MAKLRHTGTGTEQVYAEFGFIELHLAPEADYKVLVDFDAGK